MSLADELLADLEEVGGEVDEVEDVQNEDIAEAMEGVGELDYVGNQSVRAIAKLADGDELGEVLKNIKHYMAVKREGGIMGPIEADPEYQLIVDSNNLVMEIDNEINVIHKFVRSLYSKRFPELESLVHTPLEYIRTVQLLQNDLEVTKVNLAEVLPAATIMVVSVTASTTQGAKLEVEELERVMEGCEMAFTLNGNKLDILTYVESRMSLVAPNTSKVVGPTVAAKLIGVAGGLRALSNVPACNILVLGQQKKTLAGFSMATVIPHTGFIYHSDLVQSIPPDARKKVAKIVANKCTLAIRVDSLHQSPNGEFGEETFKEVQSAISRLLEPPPVKAMKPLPKPDDQIRKKRGGRRVRKMKERYAQSAMRKQTNRMAFAEIEEDAYQADLGFSKGQLGKGGAAGPIRGPIVDKKTQVSISRRLQQRLKSQVFGGKSSVRGTTSGFASSVAFTPLQGLEIVNPLAAEKRVQEVKYFSSTATFKKAT